MSPSSHRSGLSPACWSFSNQSELRSGVTYEAHISSDWLEKLQQAGLRPAVARGAHLLLYASRLTTRTKKFVFTHALATRFAVAKACGWVHGPWDIFLLTKKKVLKFLEAAWEHVTPTRRKGGNLKPAI